MPTWFWQRYQRQHQRGKTIALLPGPPESELVRMVEIIVPESDAEDLFAYIFDIAEIDKAGGGIMWMSHRILSTRYVLGSNVPDETPPG